MKSGIPGKEFVLLEFGLSEKLARASTLSTTVDPIPDGFMPWFVDRLVKIRNMGGL